MKVVPLLLLCVAACVGRVDEPAGCQIGKTLFEASDPTMKVTFRGETCTVESVAQCTYCLGPVANLGGGDIECIKETYATTSCLGPFQGTTVE